MTKQNPNQVGNARAVSIHAEIKRLTGADETALEAEAPANAAEKAPLSPREFIDQWMAEHDRKRADK